MPPAQVESVLDQSIVHPWTIVDQGGDKWRLCHDYSVGTNLHVATAPFVLPSPFDVRRVVREGSHFAKYDIRDGFFHVPVHPASRNRMLIRHPVTGRLMRCTRLPFGYVDSPRCACAVSEEMARLLRKRLSRDGVVGVHVLAYVDDYLIIGDTEALARLGA